MMIRGLGLALSLSLANVAAAESAGRAKFPVQAAILLNDGEPVASSVLCLTGQACEIFSQERDGFSLSLAVPEKGACSNMELRLGCVSGSCSFGNGSSTTTFSHERKFDFYEGSEHGNELVFHHRRKLGSVLLILPERSRGCHTLPFRFYHRVLGTPLQRPL